MSKTGAEQLRSAAEAKADMEVAFELSDLKDQFNKMQQTFSGLTSQQQSQGTNQTNQGTNQTT